jgi:extracellular elastinolytic metalloproteinase
MGSKCGRSKLSSLRLPIAVVGVLALLVLTPASTLGVVQIADLHGDGLADFDSRAVTVAPSAASLDAAQKLGATTRWSELGTLQSLIKHGGFLATGVRGQTASDAAHAWLRANTRLFGAGLVAGLRPADDARLVGTGSHAVVFRQSAGGLPVSPGGVLTVGVTSAGQDRWNVAYVSSTAAAETVLTGAAGLSQAEAWTRAAAAVGKQVAPSKVRVTGEQAGWTSLSVAGFELPQLVRAVGFPAPRKGLVRAYETYVGPASAEDAEAYRQIVDAATGKVLYRENAVDHAADNPAWKVFPAYPPLTTANAFPWGYPSTDTRDVWCWNAAPGCDFAVANPAAGLPWDVNPRNLNPTLTTEGNSAEAHENWFDSFEPNGTGFQPESSTRDYVYPWTNAWFETSCDPANFVVGSGNDISAATVNLFVMHNRMHDWSYRLGFDEEHWNAQDRNFSDGTRENDRLIGDVQAGGVVGGFPTYSGRDNANMFTRPDGRNSWTNMYLWQPLAGSFYAPCVDGDYDMAVIGHEYGHMIENRMIGKGDRRSGFHAGAMGESFSDFDAMEQLNNYGLVPVGGEDPWAVGAYVTGNPVRAIRNYNMRFPSSGQFPQPGTYALVNPLNFSDIGYDLTGPQVHADGEIWSATNFDIRELFLGRYPGGAADQRACADGQRAVSECPGNRRWIQLVYDAMLLMPTAPTMLDARDAYLAADMMRFGGANQDLLWLAFARRGFGQGAFVSGPGNDEPKPDFESPVQSEATVVFETQTIGENGVTPVASVFVGHYEGRVSPIADTNPATNASGPGANNLDAVARFVVPEDSYEFIAKANGYGHVRFRLDDLVPGETRLVTIKFRANLASKHRGAVATADGVRPGDLIDDAEATNWESDGVAVAGRKVTVDLAGGIQTFDRVKVSAALRPPQNRFTAVRAFELYVCTVGRSAANPACDGSQAAGFTRIFQSGADAFPGDNPRPVQPVLILRSFDVPRTAATHVQIRVVANQCTGQVSFQGEQDNDPQNTTDCRVGSGPLLPRRDRTVRIAELEVFGGLPLVTGASAVD